MKAVLLVGIVAGLVAASAAAAGGSTHTVRAPRIRGASDSSSTNWSGYAVTGGTFTDVKGSWKEPSVSCPTATATTVHGKNGDSGQNGVKNAKPSRSQPSYSSFWVGLDGDLSNTVEQTGTDSDCNGSTPQYYAWYEFYPAFPVNLPNPVQPGDAMTGEVSVTGGNVTVTLSDATQGWSFTTTQPDKNYSLSSAEWIAEAPSSGHVLPLADFGTVNFTAASATGNGVNDGPISAFNYDQITMVTTSGAAKATPSPLNKTGDGFSVTWSHS
jgi:hypothetical protein